MSAVSKEQAFKEVNNWLDFKKVSESKRLKAKANIKRIAEGFMDGLLEMDPESRVITQNLKFPFPNEMELNKLRFKPTLEVQEIQKRLVGVSAKDGYGRAFAHIAAATGEDKTVIAKMNYEDYSLSGDLVIFFMF
jgi:hypothetical protein